MGRKRKSTTEASRLLAEYEILNSDLDRATRRQLAVFVLAPRVGKRALEELFQRPFGQTLTRHRSWLWYNAIRLSRMEHLWPEFVSQYNTGTCLHCCLKWLRSSCSSEEWSLLSRRLGSSTLDLHDWTHVPHKPRQTLWTPGGSWDRRNNFTRVILLGENLERDHGYSAVTRALTRQDCRLIEHELSNLYNPDRMLAPHIITEAVEYVRRRIPGQLGYKRPRCSYKTVSWFFQQFIPHPRGGWVDFRSPVNYPVRRMNHGPDYETIDWLPKK